MQKIGDITDTADGNGEFTDGNVAGNVQPTELMAAWFNSVQRELIAVLKEAGITPDKGNDAQLIQAIQQILATGIAGSGYLISKNNLSDLDDASKARGHLGLDNVGNWAAVQANGGKHSSGDHHYYVDWNDGLYMTVDDTDLGRVFTESHPPTAAQTGAYPLSGGYLNDEASIALISTTKDAAAGQGIYSPMVRAIIRGRGGDMDFGDGASACFRLVEVVSNYAFAEILVDGYGGVTSYQFRNDGSFRAPGYLYAGGAFVAPDANLYGSVWGGYLNQWVLAQDNALNVALNTQITNLNNSISAQLNNMNADRNNCVRAIARGGQQHKAGGDWIGNWEAPGGCSVTGFNTDEGNDGRKMGIYYRANYYYTNASGWVQAGDIA